MFPWFVRYTIEGAPPGLIDVFADPEPNEFSIVNDRHKVHLKVCCRIIRGRVGEASDCLRGALSRFFLPFRAHIRMFFSNRLQKQIPHVENVFRMANSA